ncbi:lipopolysaccharide biosynthesis protein [Salinibacter ruber]|uniref:lipopolysaccharide biosynthesis protein n=1 Tax=Salinibacter ruber TaxID=146919 RepID=UPI000DDAEF3A|nr:oligosaccharide flippase family protein [Salinibacter ruber]
MIGYLREIWSFVKGRFARDAATVGGGAAFGQLLVVASSPILTRLYTPEEFGVLAVFAAIVGTLFAVLAGRYELAIPLPESDRLAASVTVLGFGIVLLISAGTGLVLFLWGGSLVKLTNTPTLEPYLWLIPVGLLGAGGYKVFNYWVIRRKEYAVVARTKVTQNVARVASQVGMGVGGAGAVGLLVGQVLGRVGGIGSLAAYTFRHDWSVLRTVTIRRMRYAARRYKRFPFLSGPSGLLNKGALKLPELLFASLFAANVAGWLSLAQRVISLPTWLVSQAIQQVYLGEASDLARDDPEELGSLYLKVSGFLAIVGILPALGLWGLGSTLFPIIFGEGWVEAGYYTEYLSLTFFAQIVVNPLSMTLNVLERQELQLVWDALRFVMVILILGGGSVTNMSARTTVALFSGGLFLTYLLLWFLCLYAIRVHAFSPEMK